MLSDTIFVIFSNPLKCKHGAVGLCVFVYHYTRWLWKRTANTNWCHLGPVTGTEYFILAALIWKMPIRWKRRRERGGEGSIIHQKQRENIDIDREDGGGRAIRWCLALGIRKYRMWHLHVRRLRQTTVRAHVILTQDTGRADYWTSAYCSLSSLTLSLTQTRTAIKSINTEGFKSSAL